MFGDFLGATDLPAVPKETAFARHVSGLRRVPSRKRLKGTILKLVCPRCLMQDGDVGGRLIQPVGWEIFSKSVGDFLREPPTKMPDKFRFRNYSHSNFALIFC